MALPSGVPWLLREHYGVGEGEGAWEGPSGRREAIGWGEGRLGSVVDPENSGHFSGGIWREWDAGPKVEVQVRAEQLD